MATPRTEPYVWVTWITKIMTGEAHCEWAAWFRAHNSYDKLPSDFDVATWTANHTALVKERAETLRGDGYDVHIESQNAFKLRGSQGTVLAGKPDIVATRGDEAIVVDCKTGSPKLSDHFQVLTYMLVLPHTHEACRDRTLVGEVRYKENAVPIPASKLDDDFKARFKEIMRRVGGAAELSRVPSFDECRFCDIGPGDCPKRVDEPTREVTAEDVF
jgi:hypothetical protein